MRKLCSFLLLSLVASITLQVSHAEEIQPYHAEEIQPYHAEEIGPYQAEEIQRYNQEVAEQIQKNMVVLKIGDNQAISKGELKKLDVTPVVIQGRTLVPVRFISESLGSSVSWNPNDQLISINLENTTIKLWINKETALVNDQPARMDVPPQIINGRAFVPIRFISQNLNQDVYYDKDSQQILIYPKGSLEIEAYTSSDIEPFQADDIEIFQAEDIEKYQAEQVKVNPPAPSIKINIPNHKNSSSSKGSEGSSSSNGLLFSPADGFRYSDPNGFWGQQWLNPLGW